MGEKVFYKAGYKYQLSRDYEVQTNVFPDQDIVTEYVCLSKSGLLKLKEGYASDGPSGPTVDTKDSIRGSFGHDGFYQLIRLGLLDNKWRPVCDSELRRWCLEDGMCEFRAWYWYEGVRLFAGPASEPINDNPELSAP